MKNKNIQQIANQFDIIKQSNIKEKFEYKLKN